MNLTLQLWQAYGLPLAQAEYRFYAPRRWKFDFAFINAKVAVEVQGGIFGTGRRCPTCKQTKAGAHIRGARLVKEHEKLNTAAALGWRVLYCVPGGATEAEFIRLLSAAVKV